MLNLFKNKINKVNSANFTHLANIESSKNKANRLDWPLLILGLIILLLVNLNQNHDWTQGADFSIYDNHLQHFPQVADESLLIVEIDEQSLSLLGAWPWPRSYHAQMIEVLSQADASVIAYNVIFSNANLEDKNDQLLANALKKSGRTILPLYFDRLLKQGDVSEVLPAMVFREQAGLGHVNSYLDADGTLRSIRLFDRFKNKQKDQRWPHFSLAAFLRQPSQSHAVDQYYDDNVFIPFVTQGDFQRVSFVDVLTGLIPTEQLAKRPVFVGMTATAMGDPLLIPTNVGGRQTPAVEINANVYQALKQEQLIKSLPVFYALLINSFWVIAALYLMPRISGLQQFLVTTTFILLVWLSSYGLLFQGYWYRSAGLLIVLLAIPFVWNILRLSRLFNYLRTQVNQLKRQQAKKVFRLPNYHGLDTEDDLIAFLNIMQISDYRVISPKVTHNEHLSSVDWNLDEEITQEIKLQLQGEEKILSISFKEYTALEKNKLNILKQLLLQKQREENSIYNRSQIDRDVFQQQLALMGDFQQQVSISQALFEESIDGVAAGILVSDLTGKVLFKNTALTELIDLEANNTQEMFKLIHLLNGDWLSLLREAVLLQHSVTAEAKINSLGDSNAGQKDVSVSIRCLQNKVDANLIPLAPMLVFNISDISSIKQAQRSRSEMIDFLSHDLRSPMASLQAMVNQLRSSDFASLDIEDLINKVDTYSQRGLNFSEQFLELAKIETDEEIEFYEMDLYAIAQNACDALYHQAKEKNISLLLDIEGDHWLLTNGEMLERVLLNLVSNAIKYGPANSQVVLSVTELEATELEGQLIQICVKDQGPGIPADLSQRLFKPYARGKDSNTQKSQGIGLGLRFVDVALKRLHSQIEFESSAQGTRFFFKLPVLEL